MTEPRSMPRNRFTASSLRGGTLRVLALTMALAGQVSAQQPAGYRPSPDSSWIESLNIFKMYFVRGGDTLGNWVHALSIERHRWLGGGSTLELRQLRLDAGRKVDSDTLTLSPSGRVLAINGKEPGATPRGQYDALPRLPDPPRALRPGDTWDDSIRIEGATASGIVVYAGARNYRVVRSLDTLGARDALEVSAEGALRYRDGYWADSAAGRSMWIDVSGLMTGRFLFDTARGRLLGNEWSMHLRGTAGLPNQSGGEDTVPAGLNSSNVERLVSAERAAALSRPLGTGDTLVSYARGGAEILVHVGSRHGDTLRVAMARNDGMMGTARAVINDNGAPIGYHALWTDSTGHRNHRVEVAQGKVIAGSARRDVPATPWAVADYAMDHLVVPMLRSMPADDEPRPITIYRPYPDKWDTGTARIRPIPGGFLGIILMEGAEQPDVLVMSDQWRLVAVVSQGTGTERVPREGSEARAIMERLLAAIPRR